MTATGMGWMPIESAPKDGTVILLCSPAGTWVAKYKRVYYSGALRENPWFSLMLNHVHMADILGWEIPTHWMPLPPPPSTT